MHRILVVDHHPTVLAALVDIVTEESGMELAGVASTVQEAIDQARSLKPDIVLIDMDLPGEGGKQLVGEISGFLPQARLILMSALSPPIRIRQDENSSSGHSFEAGPLAKTLVAPNMLKELYSS